MVPQPKPKRTRIGRPKTRTGCLTCKTRRIKCDEGLPECRRCKSAGWTCEGYAKNRASNIETEISIVKQKPASLAPQMSSPIYYDSPQEARSLHYFVMHSSSSLAGCFGDEFWKIQLPQAAQEHKMVRHAMVAVASLHELLAAICTAALGLMTFDAADVAVRQRFAIQQYNTAIQTTRRLMSRTPESMEAALLSCILFICFEFLQSRFNVAAVHLQSGLQIMREWHLGLREKNIAQLPSFQRNLIQIFNRLSISTFSMDEPLSYMCSASISTPSKCIEEDLPFSSLQEARQQLDRLLLESSPKKKLCEELAISPSDPRCIETSAYLLNLRKQLTSWSSKYDIFLSTHKSSFTPLECSASHVLQRTQLMTYIWAATALTAEETAYDAHFAAFESIVLHVELQLAEEISNQTLLHDFTFETGFLMHTYFVARKCRDRRLRRRALEILENAAPRQEGVYKAGVLANVARRLIEMEEEGMEDLADDGVGWEENEGSANDVLPEEENRVLDTCGVAGDNVWVQDWKNGRGEMTEHKLLLREQSVTFVLRPKGVHGNMEFRAEMVKCMLSKSDSL